MGVYSKAFTSEKGGDEMGDNGGFVPGDATRQPLVSLDLELIFG